MRMGNDRCAHLRVGSGEPATGSAEPKPAIEAAEAAIETTEAATEAARCGDLIGDGLLGPQPRDDGGLPRHANGALERGGERLPGGPTCPHSSAPASTARSASTCLGGQRSNQQTGQQ